jgi:hypothetical protein
LVCDRPASAALGKRAVVDDGGRDRSCRL